MAKRLLSTLLFLGFFGIGNSNAQVNTYFEHQPVWKLSSQCAVIYPCVDYENYNYYINGDTVFNALIYKKFYRKGEGTHNWMAGPPAGCSGSYSYIYTTPSFFLRSDNKQVYMRLLSDTAEYLLYDFNLNVGDSLPITYNNYESGIIVTGIDSIYTPYGYRKKFLISGNTWSQELMEGIGHTRGLIEPMNVPLECGFMLDCYSLNDTAYYPSTGLTCNISVGLSEQGVQYTAALSPNPASTTSMLSINNTIASGTVEIYNSMGQKIKSIDVINSNKVELHTEKLPAGVYSINLYSNHTLLVKESLVIMN